MSHRDLLPFCVSPDRSLRDAIAQLDANGEGILVVIEGERQLLGTVTDGDVRRALLDGRDLNSSVGALVAEKPAPRGLGGPLSAPAGTPAPTLLRLMTDHELRHIPLVDSDGRVASIALLKDLVRDAIPQSLPLDAVIMAGGLGTRMRPLTDHTPKPMLPVAGKPLLEHIVERLREAGVTKIHVAMHYLPDVIVDYFGDGTAHGVALHYLQEDIPLGTAGALRLVGDTTNPLLVVNGDILTELDYRSMFAYHREYKADLTIAVRQHAVSVPYGVVECEGPYVRGLVEKPEMTFFVNAGVYLLEPEVIGCVPEQRRFDMTEVIGSVLRDGGKVASFLVREYWVDIGRHEDYGLAQDHMRGASA